MGLALASLSAAMQIEAEADADMSAAMQLEVDKDRTWPDDDCCRLYSEKSFKGESKDYCTDNPTDVKVFDLSTLDDGDWDNKMRSWKCGPNVSAKFCTRANRKLCD